MNYKLDTIIIELISKQDGDVLLKSTLVKTPMEVVSFIKISNMERSRNGFYAVGETEITTITIIR